MGWRVGAGGLVLALMAPPLAAAEALSPLPGATLSPVWIVPFVGILLSIALVPLTAPNFWHHHFGKTSAFWALAFVIPFAAQFGVDLALHEVAHTLLAEYLPFMILLLALYTVAGGIHIRGNLHATPALNTSLLALGTVLASVMGTTGAAMLLIRPLLRANDNRRHQAHVVIFFIFLVANVGGALTPLGDPPLFLGFLKGVDFFWTMKTMVWPTFTAALLLLAIFYAIDRWFFTHGDEQLRRPDPTPDSPVTVQGKINFVLLAAILAAVLLSGLWKPDLEIDDLRHGTRVAERDARSRAAGDRLAVVAAHAAGRSPRAPLLVGADRRGRQAVRGDLSHDHPGHRHPARRQRRRAGAARGAGVRSDRTPEQCALFLDHRSRSRAYSTTLRPTSCSSMLPAAIRPS